MTELDQALVPLRQSPRDHKSQANYFDLFLNSTFFVPILHVEHVTGADAEVAAEDVLPLILEVDGNDYMLLFDNKERLHAWAKAEVESVEVPGYVLAATTQPPLHWALNVGTEYTKQFIPEEIAWLKDSVEQCNAEAAGETEERIQ
ncbi:hypothetical protein OR1_01715 [Geobacter sp. OR-1]|uniref:SseB family protein n=1 Tax=Geobacter sp. OR-1 TaxID=1266765 RepID=UPI00054238F7|nr:SseB family protein [Geobacter sp. OR-1]GAM09436.1 hypothetical protein OR1_01715 [Geobacter sp. OR-1]